MQGVYKSGGYSILGFVQAMFAALLKCLPKPDASQPYFVTTRHILYAQINHDAPPRDVPSGDHDPIIRYPSERITQLLVAEMSSQAQDAKLEKVISLKESE